MIRRLVSCYRGNFEGPRKDSRPTTNGGPTMSREQLQRLMDKAKTITMTSAQRESQRRSFAFGNANIENERVTRELVDEVASSMANKEKRR